VGDLWCALQALLMAPLFVLLEAAFATGACPELAETVEKASVAKIAEMNAASNQKKTA